MPKDFSPKKIFLQVLTASFLLYLTHLSPINQFHCSAGQWLPERESHLILASSLTKLFIGQNLPHVLKWLNVPLKLIGNICLRYEFDSRRGVGEHQFTARSSGISCVKSNPNNIAGSRCSSGNLLSGALGFTWVLCSHLCVIINKSVENDKQSLCSQVSVTSYFSSCYSSF